MDIANDDLVSALIVGLRLPHAEGDRVGLRVREELEAATLDDLGDALVELESRRGRALHRDGEIRRRVYRVDQIDVGISLCLSLSLCPSEFLDT